MHFWNWVFFSGAFIIFYNYAGYALLVFLINKVSPGHKKITQPGYEPSVSFIVAAYNEALIIEQKILNSINLDYPNDKIEFVFITDGSSDDSAAIIKKYPQIRLLNNPERRGKSAALNRAVSFANNDILIINDANTFLNKEAIKHIIQHYENEFTGGVAGEKKVITGHGDKDGVGNREGIYWKYESLLKKIDSDFYSVVGAAGELFSVRRSLYENVPDETILDDFVISLKTAQKGYRIIYEPNAYAMEFASLSIEDERKRKIRISAGGFQSIKMLASLFKFWKHPRLTFLYISHRVLRWTLSPLSLILVFAANLVLTLTTNTFFYTFCFLGQTVFYFIAFISPGISANSPFKILKFIGYFVFMNISVLQGFIRFISKNQQAAWDKVKRSNGIINADK